jgi:hypothetical protein
MYPSTKNIDAVPSVLRNVFSKLAQQILFTLSNRVHKRSFYPTDFQNKVRNGAVPNLLRSNKIYQLSTTTQQTTIEAKSQEREPKPTLTTLLSAE